MWNMKVKMKNDDGCWKGPPGPAPIIGGVGIPPFIGCLATMFIIIFFDHFKQSYSINGHRYLIIMFDGHGQ